MLPVIVPGCQGNTRRGCGQRIKTGIQRGVSEVKEEKRWISPFLGIGIRWHTQRRMCPLPLYVVSYGNQCNLLGSLPIHSLQKF